MSNGMYDILGKLAALTPKQEPKQETSKPIYESVEARGSMLEGVSAIESKLKEQFAESAAPGQEDWIKSNKANFIKQYGKKKGLEVLYATAWKRSGKNESAGVCAECGMNEGECEHSAMAEGETTDLGGGRRVHKGTYGTEYNGDEDDEDGKPSAEKRGRGRPKKGADSTGKVASYNAGPLNKALGIGEGEITKTKTGIVHKAGPGGYGRQFDTDDEGNEVAPQVKRGRGRPSNPAKASVGNADALNKLQSIFGKMSLGESINFKKLMDDTDMSLNEILACIQHDIKEYKQTGAMSETLRDFLDLYRHGRKQADEAVNPNVPAVFRKQAAAPGEQWKATAADIDAQRTQHLSSPEGLAQRKREMGIDATHELNELARLAGIAATESIGAPRRSGYRDFCPHCEYETSFSENGVCMDCGISIDEWDADDNDPHPYKNDLDEQSDRGANEYQVEVDLYDHDEPVVVTVHTDADLSNTDEDMFASEIENCLRDQGIDVDENLASWDLLNPPAGWTRGHAIDEADAPVAQPKTKPVNAPNVKVGTTKQITSQGDDLNRQKKQFASKPFRGDNPMSPEVALEAKLQAEYDSIKKQK